MSATGVLRIEIDGRPPTVEALQRFALTHEGHFTAAQVRDRCVRGLELHLRGSTPRHASCSGSVSTGIACAS